MPNSYQSLVAGWHARSVCAALFCLPAGALAQAPAGTATAAPAPLPPIEARYRLADRYAIELNDMFVDRGPADEEGGSEKGVSPAGRFKIVAREQPYGRGIPELWKILAMATEEPEMPVSIRGSPDSTRILTWRLGITQANPIGSLYLPIFRYIYPLAGAEKLPQATRYVIDVDVESAPRRREAKLVRLDIPSESLLLLQREP